MSEIVYFDRYRQELCREKVYGDKAMRWTYGTVAGRTALELFIKRAFFSRWYGRRMDKPQTAAKVQPFIEEFELDPDEFLQRPDEFRSFNEFFSRRLKPSARPIAEGEDLAVFPADGRHLCVPDLDDCGGLFVKGEMFDLSTLLQDEALTAQFRGGSLLLSRLCPVDYHRYHFPVAGIPGEARLLNGPLYSVNPMALCRNISILATNKRMRTVLKTESWGDVILLEVGATCVGSIHQTYDVDAKVMKGAEKGYFRFGGSSFITIFERGRIQFDSDLVTHSSAQRELYARMGDRLGVLQTAGASGGVPC